jgi:hypothetical protein
MDSIIDSINVEKIRVDIQPYTHNIISILLRQLNQYKTKQEMENFIIENGLRKLGW